MAGVVKTGYKKALGSFPTATKKEREKNQRTYDLMVAAMRKLPPMESLTFSVTAEQAAYMTTRFGTQRRALEREAPVMATIGDYLRWANGGV